MPKLKDIPGKIFDAGKDLVQGVGDFLTGGGQGATTTNQLMPEWQSKAYEKAYNEAMNTRNGNPESRIYQGDRVAPFSNLQEKGLNRTLTNLDKYQPEAEEISNTYRNILNENPGDIAFNRFTGTGPDDLFSAYFEKLYQPRAEELNREHNIAAQQNRFKNAFNSGFGSSDYLFSNQLQQESRDRALRQLSADIFGQAMNAYQTEEQRALDTGKVNTANQIANKEANVEAAASMMNNLITKHNLTIDDIKALLAGGSVQQGLNQDQIDSAMQKFNEMNNFDRSEIAYILSVLGGIPSSQTSTSAKTKGAGLADFLGFGALPLVNKLIS